MKLKEVGYWNVDALDGSETMLELARKRNIYQNYYEEILLPHTALKKVPLKSYNAILGASVIGHNHLNAFHIQHVFTEPAMVCLFYYKIYSTFT